MATAPKYRIRPGTGADLPKVNELFCQTIGETEFMYNMFPKELREQHPGEFEIWTAWRLRQRFWEMGVYFTVIVDENDEPVGFTIWNIGKAQESFYKRWISPSSWLSPVVLKSIDLEKYMYPISAQLPRDVLTPVTARVTPQLINTPRRKGASLLIAFGVSPALHGRGLGSRLLSHGLAKLDERGVDAWLIRAKGLAPFYERFGFKDGGTYAVDELAHWEDGVVMFRE